MENINVITKEYLNIKHTSKLSEEEKKVFIDLICEKNILNDSLPDDGYIFWMSNDNDIISFSVVRPDYDFFIDDFNLTVTNLKKGFYISDVYTSVKYRKRGYANKLLENLLKYFKNKDIYLEVLINNFNAISLYEKLNFIKVAKYCDEGYGEVYLMKYKS